MGQTEDDGRDQERVEAAALGGQAFGQEILEDATEQQLLRNRDGEVNDAKLHRKLEKRGLATGVGMQKVQADPEWNHQQGQKGEIGEAVAQVSFAPAEAKADSLQVADHDEGIGGNADTEERA